jgi:hypothetical protein
MPDTSPEVQAEYEARLARMSDGERLLMALRMFDAARELARAGILHDEPHLTPVEVEQRLFDRFYGGDVSPERRRDILGKIGRGELGLSGARAADRA